MASNSSKYTSKLFNARVLVIGGTSGIGFCIAEAALENGAFVIVAGSSEAKLSKTLERLRSAYPASNSQVSGHICDLSQTEQLEANIEALLKKAAADSKIDHITFTAGPALNIYPVSEVTPEAIHKTGAVRFLRPLLLAKLAPKYLRPGHSSSITLTGGSNTDKPLPGWTLQASYGAAIEGMTRGLAVDMKPARVNMVSPGAVHTELFGDISEESLQRMRDISLTGTVGRPEDVAEAYIYAMKDKFITGSIIQSNGGRLLK